MDPQTAIYDETELATKVLLVEDDAGNLIFLKYLLESIKCHFSIAQTGEEAITTLASQTFDVILMDLHLPDMDGFSLCKKIREQIVTQTAAIVGISAEVSPTIRKQCMDAGMKNLYSKLLDANSLQDIISRYTLNKSKG